MTLSKGILYITLTLFGTITSHDFYYVQRMVEQIAPTNFHQTWNLQLEKTLKDFYHTPLHKRRTKELLRTKQEELKSLKKIDLESYIYVGLGFLFAAHFINHFIIFLENIEACIPEPDTCPLDIYFTFHDSYFTRKEILFKASQYIALPFLCYGLSIDRYNNKIDHMVNAIKKFNITLQ